MKTTSTRRRWCQQSKKVNAHGSIKSLRRSKSEKNQRYTKSTSAGNSTVDKKRAHMFYLNLNKIDAYTFFEKNRPKTKNHRKHETNSRIKLEQKMTTFPKSVWNWWWITVLIINMLCVYGWETKGLQTLCSMNPKGLKLLLIQVEHIQQHGIWNLDGMGTWDDANGNDQIKSSQSKSRCVMKEEERKL